MKLVQTVILILLLILVLAIMLKEASFPNDEAEKRFDWCMLSKDSTIRVFCLNNIQYFSYLGGISPYLSSEKKIQECSCNK